MNRLFVNCTLVALLTTIVNADSYQNLIKACNERQPAEQWYQQLGQNLSKHVATDAERSNLSFITIYGEIAQGRKKSLSEQIKTLVKFAPKEIDDASLSKAEKQYRISHYVCLVVLCVASHIHNENVVLFSSENIIDRIKKEITSLGSFLHTDIYQQLVSLNTVSVNQILTNSNFTELYQLAKEYVDFYEFIKNRLGKMPGGLLYLIPDQAIKYQEALQSIQQQKKLQADTNPTRFEGVSSATPGTKPLGRIKDESSFSAVSNNRASLNAALLARTKKEVNDREVNDVDSPLKPQLELSALFGGGKSLKAEEMRRKSMAVAAGQASIAGTNSPTSVVEDPTPGKWTVEKLEDDALRQIKESNLSEELTEDSYDADENEIKISLKEKMCKSISMLIKSNKPRIDNNVLTIDQLAIQISGLLSKKGVKYNNPIASSAPTGYKRADTKPLVEKTGQPKPVLDIKDIQKAALERQQKALEREAAERGITVEKLKERKEKEENDQALKIKDVIDASQDLRQKNENKEVLTLEQKQEIYTKTLPQYDKLDKQIEDKEKEKEQIITLLTKKTRELAQKKGGLDAGKKSLSEEEKKKIAEIITGNTQKIEELTRELEAIEAEDDELKNIHNQLNEVKESTTLTPSEKAKRREALKKQEKELEGKKAERATKKSQLRKEQKDLQNTRALNQRKLDSGDATEVLRAECSTLEREIAAAESEISQLEQQIRKLEGEKIQIFLDKGLTAAEIEVFKNKANEQERSKSAATTAGLLQSSLSRNKFFKNRMSSEDNNDED